MASKRVAKSTVDWAKFAERVTENNRSAFGNFRVKSEGYARQLNVLPPELPKINFEQYRAKVSPQVLDQFAKQYASVTIPYPVDKENRMASIAEQEKEAKEHTVKLISKSNKRIEEYKQELARWDKVPPFDHMTSEEFNIYFPEHAVADPYQKPQFYPFDEEENDPEAVAKQSNYKVPVGPLH